MDKKLLKEKKTFTKNDCKDYEEVSVSFFSDEDYKIPIALISDINFEAIKDRRSGKISVVSGYIEFSTDTLYLQSNPADEELENVLRRATDFIERLKGSSDIGQIEFLEGEKSVKLSLPCNPLSDCNGSALEYSNCPSCELTHDGALRVNAGKSSKNAKREPVLYSDVCKNWEKVIGQNYRPDLLQGEMLNLSVNYDEIVLEFEIYNSKCPLQYVEFGFKNYILHNFDVYLERTLADDIKLERMMNGHFLLLLLDCGICLECESVSVYHPI